MVVKLDRYAVQTLYAAHLPHQLLREIGRQLSRGKRCATNSGDFAGIHAKFLLRVCDVAQTRRLPLLHKLASIPTWVMDPWYPAHSWGLRGLWTTVCRRGRRWESPPDNSCFYSSKQRPVLGLSLIFPTNFMPLPCIRTTESLGVKKVLVCERNWPLANTHPWLVATKLRAITTLTSVLRDAPSWQAARWATGLP